MRKELEAMQELAREWLKAYKERVNHPFLQVECQDFLEWTNAPNPAHALLRES